MWIRCGFHGHVLMGLGSYLNVKFNNEIIGILKLLLFKFGFVL
jgi:hypothetical protein